MLIVNENFLNYIKDDMEYRRKPGIYTEMTYNSNFSSCFKT